MLSRLLRVTSPLLRVTPLRSINDSQQLKQNVICKRWSGHNAMVIKPSNASWKIVKNWMHFYICLATIPMAVITAIINIRANPELTEIPEGYEPRYWEYYKNPITRWMAKYMYKPMELDHELMMDLKDKISQREIIIDLRRKVDIVMRFYNDHRTRYFLPYYGEYYRAGREQANAGLGFTTSSPNVYYDKAFDPKTSPVPVEGFPDGPPE